MWFLTSDGVAIVTERLFDELLYIYQTICSFNTYNNHHLQRNTGSNTLDMASPQCVIGL